MGREMKIVDDVFARKRPNFEKLLKFGFLHENDVYTYTFDFLSGEFEGMVTVHEDGRVDSKVIEKALDEEYFAINVEGYEGAFVADVKEAYREKLQEIADKCFFKVTFKSNQANRLTALIKAKYGEDPDFPFEKLETAGVFRYPVNRKWYGLVMAIPAGKLFKNDDKREIDVLNLKIDESRHSELMQITGIYPAYHMHRDSWASIVLDDSVDDDFVMSLIDVSRNYAIASKGMASGRKKKIK